MRASGGSARGGKDPPLGLVPETCPWDKSRGALSGAPESAPPSLPAVRQFASALVTGLLGLDSKTPAVTGFSPGFLPSYLEGSCFSSEKNAAVSRGIRVVSTVLRLAVVRCPLFPHGMMTVPKRGLRDGDGGSALPHVMLRYFFRLACTPPFWTRPCAHFLARFRESPRNDAI